MANVTTAESILLAACQAAGKICIANFFSRRIFPVRVGVEFGWLSTTLLKIVTIEFTHICTFDERICWNSNPRLPRTICRPRKTNFPFLFQYNEQMVVGSTLKSRPAKLSQAKPSRQCGKPPRVSPVNVAEGRCWISLLWNEARMDSFAAAPAMP
jgi:hypothetical protein